MQAPLYLQSKRISCALNGSGVTVAVIDSGIAYHNDLKVSGSNNKYRIIANEYFTGSGGSDDLYGHGTHVAGIIGGNEKYLRRNLTREWHRASTSSASRPVYEFGITYESDVMDGLQWVLDNKSRLQHACNKHLMNSTVTQSYHTSPLDKRQLKSCGSTASQWLSRLATTARQLGHPPSTRPPTIPS